MSSDDTGLTFCSGTTRGLLPLPTEAGIGLGLRGGRTSIRYQDLTCETPPFVTVVFSHAPWLIPCRSMSRPAARILPPRHYRQQISREQPRQIFTREALGKDYLPGHFECVHKSTYLQPERHYGERCSTTKPFGNASRGSRIASPLSCA